MVKCGLSMKKRSKIYSPDYLTPLLGIAPASWALIRANEIRALDKINFIPPVLDIGCGDGVVAKLILSRRKIKKFDVGIDMSQREVEKAIKSGAYKKCIVANVYDLPFKNGTFKTVFSNSVIEHIPDLDLTITEISRVLKKDGEAILTVPSKYLENYLIGGKVFGNGYNKLFNKLIKHLNLYDHREWEKILAKHGLKLTYHSYYHTPNMIRAHEILAYLAMPFHIAKIFIGYWPVFPSFRKIFVMPWLIKILKGFYLADVQKDEGGSLLIVAKKIK